LIPICEPSISKEDIAKVTECVASGWVSGLSPYVSEFEQKFAKYCGLKYGVAVNSGTTALHLALRVLDIFGVDDEVILPTFTFIATANAVSYVGATPVFVDCEPDTWNINPELIEEKITDSTKAILPVHIYGHPCDMDKIYRITRKHDLFVIEDAAEAIGAEYHFRKMGYMSDFAVYSLYANKIITCGEGGMLVTNDQTNSKVAQYFKHHAFGEGLQRYFHQNIGYNFRMTGMQAALGLSQLERVEQFVKARRNNARVYMEQLIDLHDEGTITLPVEKPYAKNVYWMFSILINQMDRNKVIQKLLERGVGARTFFYPLHKQPPYKTNESFPMAESIAERGINLPSSNGLTKEQVFYVCETLKEILS